ncbi:putative pectinesterase [Helianthus annuus]|nr:putative pectinesterase [Helianthus annuus]
MIKNDNNGGTVLNNAVEYLQDCLSEMDVKSNEKLLTLPKVEDLKTWLSTAITNQEMCIDALDDMSSNSTFVDDTKSQMKNSTEYASNRLAIVSKIARILGKLNINFHMKMLTITEPGFPEWVSPGVRRLLQEVKSTPNVTVAADGSGDVRTIKEAMAMVTKKSKSVFIIHIKEGVYKENVVLDKSFWNVMIYGDGKTKSIVSGSLNFIDTVMIYGDGVY